LSIGHTRIDMDDRARDDLPHRLAAKLEEVRAFADELSGLLVEAALAGLVRLPDAPQLTRREHDVLRLMANGMTNREIAEALSLSEHTIKDHLSIIYKRLEVRNRAGAIARAHDAGLL
jgi:ATP/maltotriose-dependent transcriptional regulator MalT